MTAGPETRIATLDLNLLGGERHGRAFFSADKLAAVDPADLAAQFGRIFADAEDLKRLALLEQVLARRSLTVATYPGEGMPPEWHAYVVAPEVSEAPIFACVLAPTAVIRHLLREPPHVVLETATFQFVGDEVTVASVAAALETWIRRVFPGVSVPQLHISPWPGAVESKDLSVEIMRLSKAVSLKESLATGPDAYSPPTGLVAEEYRWSGAA